MAEAVDYKQIGSRPIRPDGVDKVTGRARFGADLILPNMIHGKVLRSPHAHACIKSIDLSGALAMDGVLAAVCGDDFPGGGIEGEASGEGGGTLEDIAKNVMARDKVLYHGHAVAAVAARTPAIANEALTAIKVEYEVLPPVLDVIEAMQEGSTLVDENCYTALPEKPQNPSNVAAVGKLERGNVEEGFELADVVIEREYKVPMAHQGYIEPHACVANIDETGRGSVWTCTQGHFEFRTATANILGKDVADLKFIASEIGGGFGGKTVVYLEPLAV